MPPEHESPLQSLTATNVVIVAGKGGVGKTTVTAVIARAASRDGRRVLVVELDGKPTLDQLLPMANAPATPGHSDDADGVRPDIEVVHISAADALDEYLRDHGFARIAKRLNKTGVIDMVGTAAPGIDDVVVLGKVKAFEHSGNYDLIVVDGPAAGHAITFLKSATGLANAVHSGPVRSQSDEVIETAFALEDDIGVQLGPVVVNGIDTGVELPSALSVEKALASLDDADAVVVAEAEAFRRSRREMEAAEVERLGIELPIEQIRLPAQLVAGLTSLEIEALADELVGPSV